MHVDPISLIEKEKQSYGDPNPDVESFPNWLAYM